MKRAVESGKEVLRLLILRKIAKENVSTTEIDMGEMNDRQINFANLLAMIGIALYSCIITICLRLL